MRLLLDTHVLIWACQDSSRLSEPARIALDSDENVVFVSAASAWELSIKCTTGKLRFPLDEFDSSMAALGFEHLDVTAAHGIRAGQLPRFHNDPFDRLLVAQAQSEDLMLVTSDRLISRYDVEVLDGVR